MKALILVGLVACGGASKPAAQAPAQPSPSTRAVDAVDLCEVIAQALDAAAAGTLAATELEVAGARDTAIDDDGVSTSWTATFDDDGNDFEALADQLRACPALQSFSPVHEVSDTGPDTQDLGFLPEDRVADTRRVVIQVGDAGTEIFVSVDD